MFSLTPFEGDTYKDNQININVTYIISNVDFYLISG